MKMIYCQMKIYFLLLKLKLHVHLKRKRVKIVHADDLSLIHKILKKSL